MAVHSVDKVAWAMHDEPPVSCVGVGGRVIPAEGGNIYDHFEVNYIYPTGVRAMVANRQIEGCYNENADYLMGYSEGEIVVGDLRLKAARKLGFAKVPVMVCDGWTPEQVRGFLLLANRSANWAEWDWTAVAEELAELRTLQFHLSLTGFDTNKIEEVLAPRADEGTLESVPEKPQVPVSVTLSYFFEAQIFLPNAICQIDRLSASPALVSQSSRQNSIARQVPVPHESFLSFKLFE